MARKSPSTRQTRQRKPAFPLALQYSRLLGHASGMVREGRAADHLFPYSERHLRGVWFDPAFRPPVLYTQAGEEVVVEDPGRWNLEAGPDFFDAALRIGSEKRRVRGDVEIHVRPADWTSHGHSADPRYARVIAHVTYFPGAMPSGQLPAAAVQIALKDRLAANPFFSFENIDLTAYPYASRTPQAPCSEVLRSRPPGDVISLLESAGEERLRVKSERIALAIAEKGVDEALYEEVMAALGYKSNRLPFRRLARAVPLGALREAAAGDTTRAFAVLLGVSGLLPEKLAPGWDEETRTYVRSLWDIWWKQRSAWESAVMPRKGWVLAGIRPPNHPVRRLAAAASLFSGASGLTDELLALSARKPESWLNAVSRLLERGAAAGGYWSRRCSIGGVIQAKPMALLGQARVAAIIVNVVVPFLVAAGQDAPDRELLRQLPVEDDNSLVRQSAFALLGRDHNPAVYRSALRLQGLLQLFGDFCLNDRSGCSACPLPAALRRSFA